MSEDDRHEREQKAEAGRALFAHLIHSFNEHAKILQANGIQQERIARALEAVAGQLEVGLEQQRMQMEYSAALQKQIGVLCEMLAGGAVLPELPRAPVPYQTSPLEALGQQAAQHLFNGFINPYPGGR